MTGSIRIRKESMAGAVAGLQTRWGSSDGPGWVRLPLPSAQIHGTVATMAHPSTDSDHHTIRV